MAKAKQQNTKSRNGSSTAKKTPVTRKMEIRLNMNVKRLGAVSDKLSKWKADHGIGDAAKLVASAITQLEEAAELLSEVPADFVPYSFAGTPKAQVAIGSMVRVTDKRIPEYEEVLKENEMRDLTVLEERGKRLLVFSKSSQTKFLINRAHLMVQETAA
jgi:hypothetical protein